MVRRLLEFLVLLRAHAGVEFGGVEGFLRRVGVEVHADLVRELGGDVTALVRLQALSELVQHHAGRLDGGLAVGKVGAVLYVSEKSRVIHGNLLGWGWNGCDWNQRTGGRGGVPWGIPRNLGFRKTGMDLKRFFR